MRADVNQVDMIRWEGFAEAILDRQLRHVLDGPTVGLAQDSRIPSVFGDDGTNTGHTEDRLLHTREHDEHRRRNASNTLCHVETCDIIVSFRGRRSQLEVHYELISDGNSQLVLGEPMFVQEDRRVAENRPSAAKAETKVEQHEREENKEAPEEEQHYCWAEIAGIRAEHFDHKIFETLIMKAL